MSEAFPDRTEELGHSRSRILLAPPKAPRSRPSSRTIALYTLGGPGKGGRCPNFALSCYSEGDICYRCINSRLLPSEWHYFLKAKHIVAGKFNSIIDYRAISDILEEGV